MAAAGLADRLEARRDEIRPASVVMSPAVLGAARLTKYSFSRTMLRRAVANGWRIKPAPFELDAEGRGEASYRVEADGHVFHFVAFTTTLDEASHTDRVIADAWEITAALVEGELDSEFHEALRHNVPLQEDGRFDPRVLVLTRGNRSVRFFEYIVDRLAAGLQPDPDLVADSGYIMRSTAFYGNGKYGMRSFLGYPPGHPLSAPYRAQFLCAWLFRELSLDSVENCARLRQPDTATVLTGAWRGFFGLGNATGLGLVPYAFKHPRVIHAWAAVRELALANVRAMPATTERTQALERWMTRARLHFSVGSDADCTPFLSPAQLAPVIEAIGNAFVQCAAEPHPFDALYQWAETQDTETQEFVVSLLIELDDELDAAVDDLLRVEEHARLDPSITCGELLHLIVTRFDWIPDLHSLDRNDDHFSWVISDNAEEPRRAERAALDPAYPDVAIDVSLRVDRLQRALRSAATDTPIGAFLADHPDHLDAAERVIVSDCIYGEPRDNPCAATYLPLQVQRFQLAMYGMDNFKPKSTDWLRVTLFQGAPRIAELTTGFSDDWALPERPSTEAPRLEQP